MEERIKAQRSGHAIMALLYKTSKYTGWLYVTQEGLEAMLFTEMVKNALLWGHWDIQVQWWLMAR